jgi:hypothetical protein
MIKTGFGIFARLAVCGVIALGAFCSRPAAADEAKKQYWATSLSRTVDDGILKGLYEAVARGEVGWLDIDPKFSIPELKPGINLVLYHVGGNCYIKNDDCERFPDSQPTGDQWGDTERSIDLTDPGAIKIVVADLIAIVRLGDQLAPPGAIVGVHLDNVDKLSAEGIADVFNEFLAAVEAAQRQGTISKGRHVGYIAKNNANKFSRATAEGLLDAPPLYQIVENAHLNQDGILDEPSRIASRFGRRCGIPVFLKTFGSDIAFKDSGNGEAVHVSMEMSRQMAQSPNIAGVAWSPDERRYRPTLFVQGSAVQPLPAADHRCGQ